MNGPGMAYRVGSSWDHLYHRTQTTTIIMVTLSSTGWREASTGWLEVPDSMSCVYIISLWLSTLSHCAQLRPNPLLISWHKFDCLACRERFSIRSKQDMPLDLTTGLQCCNLCLRRQAGSENGWLSADDESHCVSTFFEEWLYLSCF